MYAYSWLGSALDDLAAIYVSVNLAERDRIAVAVELFNTQLALDPHDVGESRGGHYRLAFLPMMAVSFHVNEAARFVRVIGIRRYGR